MVNTVYTTSCWADPVAAADRDERLATWRGGVDAAIREMRRAEGFDGNTRTWQTLGECLPASPAPPSRPRPARLPALVRCPDCRKPHWSDERCPVCAGVRRVAS